MNELVKELMPYLEKLADKLDSSAQVLWQMQMGQAKVMLVSYLIEWVMWIVFTIILYKIWKRVYATFEGKWRERDPEYKYITVMKDTGLSLWTFIVILSSISAFLFLPSIKTIITLMVNPEYWALQEIIKMVK